MLFTGCSRKEKYEDSFTIGTTNLLRTFMPFASTDASNLYVSGLVYDTLLENGDGETTENYFNFSDNLITTESAYERKEGSDYGFVTFDPTEEQYQKQLERKNIVFGYDEAGNYLKETKEEFLKRANEAVPKTNWMEYRFQIRDGYTWNDGTPFTASDIEFCFKYILKNKGALASPAYFLTNYHDCYVEEDGDFVLLLATNKLSDIKTIATAIPILPRHVWESIEKPAEEKNLNPVGTGPYIVKEGDYIENASLTLTLRDDYNESLLKELFDHEPIQHITLLLMNNQEVMLQAMQAGDIDVSLETISTSKAHSVKKNESFDQVKLAESDSDFVTTLLFNVSDNGAFSEKKLGEASLMIRQAISLCIDQEKLIQDVLRGEGSFVGDGLVQDTHPHALKDGEYAKHTVNYEKANALLDAAGYPKNEQGLRELNFSVYALPSQETLVNAIGVQLKEAAGITISYEQAGSNYSEDIKQRNDAEFDMIINTVTFSLDKLLMFDARYGIYPNGQPRTWNFSGIYDQELSELMASMDTETDIFAQITKAQKVQEKVASLYVEVPLYCAKNFTAYTEANYTGFVLKDDEGVLNADTLRKIKRKG